MKYRYFWTRININNLKFIWPLPKYKNHTQFLRLRHIIISLPYQETNFLEALIKPDDKGGLMKHLCGWMLHFSEPSVLLSSAVTVSHVGPSSSSSSSSSTAVMASLSAAGLKIAERLSLTD